MALSKHLVVTGAMHTWLAMDFRLVWLRVLSMFGRMRSIWSNTHPLCGWHVAHESQWWQNFSVPGWIACFISDNRSEAITLLFEHEDCKPVVTPVETGFSWVSRILVNHLMTWYTGRVWGAYNTWPNIHFGVSLLSTALVKPLSVWNNVFHYLQKPSLLDCSMPGGKYKASPYYAYVKDAKLKISVQIEKGCMPNMDLL